MSRSQKSAELLDQATLFYDERFLEGWAGSIISEPDTAVVELIANCWDAYATEVKIRWPDPSSKSPFEIIDNGHGMTRDEFQHIWRTIAYNRVANHGLTTLPPKGVKGHPRPVFGKNGKGRFAAFCFGQKYTITSRKDGQEFSCHVSRSLTSPMVIKETSFKKRGIAGHGTTIRCEDVVLRVAFTEDIIREVIGSRFLANSGFSVLVNGSRITFKDIPDLLTTVVVNVDGLGAVKLHHIDTRRTDRTTKQHGIAWWVQRRSVGECKWSRSDYERILDGRSSEAKRFTFIVEADHLNGTDSILEDWSGFKEDSDAWKLTREKVQDAIRDVISESTRAGRDAKRNAVIDRVGPTVNTLSPLSKERISSFINIVVDDCPNLAEQDIVHLSSILATLEKAQSKYGLLELLHSHTPNDMDALHDILSKWTVGMAKIVLDEIQARLQIISDLRSKLSVKNVNEVHELQPLFERGLWMFGAQFESIEFTSNRGMTTVIRELFDDPISRGSRNRPDFVILPDASVGFYSRASFDGNYDENGVAHLVIVDLKTTDLAIGSKEKEQLWKYVKELRAKGHLRPETRVDGFVLGSIIESGEGSPRTEGDNVMLSPLLYDVILTRAEKRLHNLYSKVKDAPFLAKQKDELNRFTNPIPVVQESFVPDG